MERKKRKKKERREIYSFSMDEGRESEGEVGVNKEICGEWIYHSFIITIRKIK